MLKINALKSGEIFSMYLDVVLFATHATKPFTPRDLSEMVINTDQKGAYRCISQLKEQGYLEDAGFGKYRATQYAKDIMNVERKFVA